MIHIMLQRQSPSFQTKVQSSPSSPSSPLQFHSTRNPNLRCSRQEIQAPEGRQEARHLGKTPRSPIAKIHHFHESRWVQQDLVDKMFGESSIKYRNTPLRNQNSCMFLMLLKWISYVTSTHLPVFESQKSKGPSPRASWQHDAWIVNEGSLFVWSLKGATSCIPLQSIFLKYIKGYIITTATSPLPKTYFQKRRKKKTPFWGHQQCKDYKAYFSEMDSSASFPNLFVPFNTVGSSTKLFQAPNAPNRS